MTVCSSYEYMLLRFQISVKRQLDDHQELSVRSAYMAEIRSLLVAAASTVVPLSSTERSLQRYKKCNRPPLPATLQDLVLQPEHHLTTDGRQLLLIDDGVAVDRMLVLGRLKTLIGRITMEKFKF